MKKKNNKLIIICIVVIILIIILTWTISRNKTEEKNINIYDVSKIADNDNPYIRDIYHQFNPEENILFNLLGSGNDKNNYYAYYYKNKTVTSNELDNTIKTYITINSYDYKNSERDSKRNCYLVKTNDLNITSEKIFNNNSFKIENALNNPKIDIDKDNICIYEPTNNTYNYTLDTMFINGFIQDDELTIYERVAFIKINNNDIEFYSDYDMNKLVYKANKNELELSFLNNLNIVSNVLIKYQEKFDIYTYTFEKNNEHYYFKSINK